MAINAIKTDVLVIGSGGAGLRCAIELHDNNVDVTVVGKCKKGDAHTILATGGINAALGNMDPKDSWQLHAADTIRDGGYINDSAAVEVLCKNAPQAVKELVNWEANFAKDKNGKIIQRFFGAATYRRACFAGDHTGKEILDTLVRQVEKRKIKFESNVYVFSLLKSKEKVNGALALDLNSGKIIIFHAKIIVLATGGHSRIFEKSSSRQFENNGDGIYLASQAGAQFMDMEMFQFHPTGMLWPKKAEGILVTEAVRGEGGILTNSHGERFMKKYDEKRMELSARDIVARAIYLEVQAGRGTKKGGVWLDISHKPKEYILERLPTMYNQFKSFAGIDISKQKMEVGPTAHYSMAGVKVNHLTGKTSVQNLFAIGEVTAGVHGANRLGGNSLAEIMVFGRLTGQSIVKEVKKTKWTGLNEREVNGKKLDFLKLVFNKNGENPLKIKKRIQSLMWKNCGVARTEKKLKQALVELNKIKKIKLKTGLNLKNNEKLMTALDVQAMIIASEMTLKSALTRKESRGAHYRTDYQKTEKKWGKNIICTPTKNDIKISVKPIQKPSLQVQKILNKKPIISHLLE